MALRDHSLCSTPDNASPIFRQNNYSPDVSIYTVLCEKPREKILYYYPFCIISLGGTGFTEF